MKILMVCIGNICRSPLAEGILQHKALEHDLDWEVDSAGTASYHIGNPPHRLSQKIASEHGIDISTQEARQFSKKDLQDFDKIYAMEEAVYQDILAMSSTTEEQEKVDLLLNEVSPGKNQSVPDPWYGGEDGYHLAWDLIEEACNRLIQKQA